MEKNNNINIRVKKCPVCFRRFEGSTKRRVPRGRRTDKTIRGKNAFTCSPRCSAIYQRVIHHARSNKNIKM